MEVKQYFNPYKQFTGVFIPDWLLEYDECSLPAKLIYAILAKFAGQDGHCYPSQKKIAERASCSARSVRNYLSELEECGLIESRRQGLKKSNRYYFLYNEEVMGDFRPEKFAVQERKGASGQERKGRSDPIVRESKKENHSNIEGTPYEVPTKEQVGNYFSGRDKMLEEDVPIEAQKFINHYSERDWKKGDGSRIQYWKKQANTWYQNYLQFNKKRLENSSTNSTGLDYTPKMV